MTKKKKKQLGYKQKLKIAYGEKKFKSKIKLCSIGKYMTELGADFDGNYYLLEEETKML